MSSHLIGMRRIIRWIPLIAFCLFVQVNSGILRAREVNDLQGRWEQEFEASDGSRVALWISFSPSESNKLRIGWCSRNEQNETAFQTVLELKQKVVDQKGRHLVVGSKMPTEKARTLAYRNENGVLFLDSWPLIQCLGNEGEASSARAWETELKAGNQWTKAITRKSDPLGDEVVAFVQSNLVRAPR
jgi:hypothetical protein